MHINADIADAVLRYVGATGDETFERAGMELLVDTARLWRSLGHHDAQGRFRIDGVTGPDEYSAIADNNVYTNLMAQRNLVEAARTRRTGIRTAPASSASMRRSADWRDAAEEMFIPYDETLGVHPRTRTSPATTAGTSTPPRRSSIRCCCTSPISSCTANR